MIYTKKKYKNKNLGVTLIEAMLVLGFAVIISMAVLNLYRKVVSNSRASTSAGEIISIVNKLQRAYQATGNYTGLTTAYAVSNGFIPQEMVSSSSTPTFAWGGTLSLTPDSSSGGTDHDLLITLSAVPQNLCASIVRDIESSNYVSVNTIIVKNINQNISISGLANACSSGGDNNSIVLIFDSQIDMDSNAPITPTGGSGGVNPGPPSFVPAITPPPASATPAVIPISAFSIPPAQAVVPPANQTSPAISPTS